MCAARALLGRSGRLVALVLGAPVFVAMGAFSLFFFFQDGVPVAAVTAAVYRLISSPTLPAIPLLTACGYVLAESGASIRLLRFLRLTLAVRSLAIVLLFVGCACPALAKPPHNLLDDALLEDLMTAYEAVVAEGARAILLRSSMRHFCAGAEVQSFGITTVIHTDKEKFARLTDVMENVPVLGYGGQ